MNARGTQVALPVARSGGGLSKPPQSLGMAPKQGTKDESKQHGEAGKEQKSGRYEGGRDSDQNRQAKEGLGQGRDEKNPPAAPPATPGKDRHGMEEEE